MKPITTFRIRLWLPTVILALFFISIIISAVMLRHSIENELEKKSLEAVQQMLANTGHRAESLFQLGNPDLVAENVSDLGVDLHIRSLVLLDENARILESTRREWIGLPAFGRVPSFDKTRFESVRKSHRQEVYFSPGGNLLHGYQPVILPPAEGEIRSSRVGALVVDYDLAADKVNVWQELVSERVPVWSFIFFLVLVMIWLVHARVLHPLRIFTDAVSRFGTGERDVDIHIGGNGELAELCKAWNTMRVDLSATMRQLEESNENLEVTLFSIGDAVIATDAEGRVTRMNGVAQALTGWEPIEAIGRPLKEVFHILNATTRAFADDPVQHVLSTGQTVGLANHTVLIAKDGREFQIADSAAPIRNRDGVTIGVVLVFRDVTQEYVLREALEKNESLLRTIVDTDPECVKLLARDGTLLQMNRAGLQMIEADKLEQVLGKKMLDLILPPYQLAFANLSKKVFEGGVGSLEFEIQGLKGTRCWLDTQAVPMRDSKGNITALLGITRDITDKKKSDLELRIAATAFETQEGMMVTDANNVILRVNQAFSRITGYIPEEVIGKTPSMMKSGRHEPEFYQEMWDALKRENYWQGEIWNRRKSGDTFPEWLTITGVTDEAGKVINYVASFSDITQYKEAEEKIHQLAFYDPLTGLPNRRLLYDRLKKSMASSARTNCHGALLFIDLDNFKVINDTRGHDVGDMLLIEVANRLSGCVRAEDSVARLGGDEFVVMLNTLSEDEDLAVQQVEAVGSKILQVFEPSFSIGVHTHHTTPSMGICMFKDHEVTAEELLKRADAAMYQAKQSGRNTLRFFDPGMQAALEARMALEAEMRRALPANEFKLYLQLQVDAHGDAIGAEVLLRWLHPERGLIPPSQFIPLAEETGLIAPLGQWVLEEACQKLKEWESHPRTSHLQLAVNVSARQFRQGTFVDQVAHAILMSGADPNLLKLELTESLVLENVDDTIAKMHKLKAIGASFSMDDFGTGQSSLTYLKKLPLDQLKIDQSFVRDINKDDDDNVIVQTIIAMAKNLRLDVIAEGVETEEQRLFLERSGCPAYQGYLFGRPMPIEEFEAKLKA